MFYAHFVLAKKGPLARIWLAAHWDKKLTKAHVFETNIEKSVDGILQPKVKMALRTSGHLLLGVVRIYSRKAKYLLADCNEAFVKIKMAFRPGMVDLPEDIREAAVSAITFPEVFHDFDTPMPELNDVDIQAQFTLNQSRAEEITMREDYGNISLVTGDDGFGDMGFEEPPELMRATSGIDQNMDQTSLIFGGDNLEKDREANSSKEQDSRLADNRTNASALDLEAPIRDDGFGGNLGQDIISGGLFEGGLFDDASIEEAPPLDSGQQQPQQIQQQSQPQEQLDKVEKEPEDSDDDGADLDRFGGPPSVEPPSTEGGSPCPSPQPEPRPEGLVNGQAEGGDQPDEGQEAAEAEAQDQSTLLHNDEESFALAPVDSTAIKSGWPRTKRKRKLIVDEVKNISGEEMKAQLSDTSDIVTTLDLAPPSKRLMHWKETGGVEKLFALPGRSINAMTLAKMYVRHLTSEHAHNEDFGMAGDKEIENLRLEQVRDEEMVDAPVIRPRGRPPKRKYPDPETEEERPPKNKSKEESFNDLLAAQTVPEESPEKLKPDENVQNDTAASEPLMSPPEDQAHPEEIQSESVSGQTDAAVESTAPATNHTAESEAHLADVLSSPLAQEGHHGEEDMDTHTVQEGHQEEPPPPPPTTDEPPFSVPDAPKVASKKEQEKEEQQEKQEQQQQQQQQQEETQQELQQQEPEEQQLPQEHQPPSPSRVEDAEEYEEQAEDETYEQFEERVVNKRAGLMFHNIKKKLKHGTIDFSELTRGHNRKMVAQRFYTMLVLKKLQAVELSQEVAYGEISIARGSLFENASL